MPENFALALSRTEPMKLLRLVFLPVIFILTSGLPILGATASEHSCNFVNSYLDSKSKAIEALAEAYGHNKQAYQTIVGTLSVLPDKFDEGLIVETANVGDLYVEHFIVINKKEIGNVYFRLVYEKSGEFMVGVQFVFNSDAETILEDWQMLQNPVDINC